jgi:hypothetical protein
VKTLWLVFLGIYFLSLFPAGFMALAAFSERNADLSGDAFRAMVLLGVYLVACPALLLVTKPRRVLEEEAAE